MTQGAPEQDRAHAWLDETQLSCSIRGMNRRTFLASAFAVSAIPLIGSRPLPAFKAQKLVIYKSPTCGCCAKWVDHVKASGFDAEVHDVADVNAIKAKHGVPNELFSCHTALADGFVFEGHVPADLITKVLKEKPKIAGIAAPGMPIGSPGMEMGSRKDPHNIVAFTRDGKTSVYAQR